MHIPFKFKTVFVQNPTQTRLICAWNYKMEITEKDKEKKKTFTATGGKWPKHIEKSYDRRQGISYLGRRLPEVE